MFYSHEILASPQYGVATVWLVATLGVHTTNRKLNRKAIDGVNVPRACDTIEKPPGAPIALRLQGSLLFGLSGVHLKQHNYLLDDVERTWAHMRTFYPTIQQQSATNGIDFKACKAKRSQLVLADDASFIPSLHLPPLEFDDSGELRLPGCEASQHSVPTSQLSPFGRSSASLAGQPGGPFINLDIHHSSSQPSLLVPTLFGSDNQNPNDKDVTMVIREDEELPFADFGLIIDADGNLVEQSESELPPHPPSRFVEAAQTDAQTAAEKVTQSSHLHQGGEGLTVPSGDQHFGLRLGDDVQQRPPETAFSDQQNLQQRQQPPHVGLASEENLGSEAAAAPRKRREKKCLAPDAATHVSRDDFKGWTEHYVARAEEARNAPHHVTAARARKNAYNLIFGRGLMDVGLLNYIPGPQHPLAKLFAGEELKSIVMGDDTDDEDQARVRRRRSASDAFGEETDVFDQRRVRSRPEGHAEQEQQVGRNYQEDDSMAVDDPVALGDELPELGREHPGSVMSDHRRSSNVPWNRPSSLGPSSVHSQKAPGHRAVESSPLVGRGSNLPANAGFSDGNLGILGSDGFGPLALPSAAAGHVPSFGRLEAAASKQQSTHQDLDGEGRNFLGFVERVAADHGGDHANEEGRRWVDFDDIFESHDKTKPIIAQAFLNVLTLATKSQIKVRQEGANDKIPFGKIQLGVVAGKSEDWVEDVPA